MTWLTEPLNLALLAAAVVGLLVLAWWRKRKRADAAPKEDPEIKRLLDRKDYEGAARLEQKNGNLEMALEYFLRAGRTNRAAGVARQLGHARQAAELYEKCEDYKQAEQMYREAGIVVKADEMAAQIEPDGPAPTEESSPDDLLTPQEQVSRQEEAFEQLVQQARSGDEEAQQKVQAMGQEMAETLLAAGETRKAAQICRDAGLVDQAINLFVNLLGDPGSAAPLLADRGEHERAAELYEAAGQRERALAAWVKWSAEAEDPLGRLDRVQRLGDDAVLTLLDVITDRHPPSKETLALHLRMAGAFEQCKRPDSAFRLLKRLSRIDSESEEIKERLGQLREEVARTAREKKAGVDRDETGSGDGGDEAADAPQAAGDEPQAAGDEPQAAGDEDPGQGDLLELEDSDDWASDLDLDLEGSNDGASDLDLNLEGGGVDEAVNLQLGLDAGGADESDNLDLDLELPPDSEPVQQPEPEPAPEPDPDPNPDPDENLPSVPPVHDAATREVPDLATAARLFDLDLEGDAEEGQQDNETVMASSAMHQLVEDVAKRAAEETVSRVQREQPMVTVAGPGAPPPPPGQPRFEVTLRYAHDDVAAAARKGPRVAELQDQLQRQGGEPDLELLYKLGLARQVAGQWVEARRAFEEVQKVKPDFGDAAKRAKELSDWEQHVSRSMMEASREDGQQQQRYRLLGELGRGGMAVVFRAHDEALGREVALKFISEEFITQEKVLEMFQREARASAQLNHPNIVTVHDVGTLDGRAFICMELVEGQPVDELIAEQGRLKVLDTLEIIEKVLSALEYAHSKQIIHRDIKPSNIMCGDQGLVKLMDFGLAKSIADGTKTTMIAGTPNYMAPEQFTGKNINDGTDLFALGATMYEMLSGEAPFEGVQRDKPPRPVNEINSKVPNVLGILIQRALEFDQARRMNKAIAMLKPVRQILSSVGTFIQKRATEETLAAIQRTSTSSSNRPVAPALPATMDDLPESERERPSSGGGRPAVQTRPMTMDDDADGETKPGLADLASQENQVGPTGTILHGVKRKK